MKAIYLEEAIERFIQAGQNISKDQAIYILNRLPYMEIVRCRDCKHFTIRTITYSSGETWEGGVCDHYNLNAPSYDDYCSFGESFEEREE